MSEILTTEIFCKRVCCMRIWCKTSDAYIKRFRFDITAVVTNLIPRVSHLPTLTGPWERDCVVTCSYQSCSEINASHLSNVIMTQV